MNDRREQMNNNGRNSKVRQQNINRERNNNQRANGVHSPENIVRERRNNNTTRTNSVKNKKPLGQKPQSKKRQRIDLTKKRPQPQSRERQNIDKNVNERKEKKKFVSKKRIKKRNRFLAIASIVVVLVAAFTTLSLTVFFPIKTISVENNKKYSAGEIESAIGIVKGDNLLLASESRANSSIKQNYPYVKSVKFNKKLPFTLKVDVTEYSVFSQVKFGGGYLRIADDGKILELSNDYLKNVPVVTGSDAIKTKVGETIAFKEDSKDDNILSKVKEIIKAFNSSSLKGITLINFENMQDIRVTYNNKIVMLLGSSSNLSKKLTHAKATLEARGDNGESGTLNLSRIPSAKNEASFIPRELEDKEIAGK